LDVIRSGGDTDSNGAIVGNLIGAYHGFELFEEPENRWALDGLRCREELEELVNRFCDQFGI
jgi:ADP-ribosylglycohydrolase